MNTVHTNLATLERAYRSPAVRPGVSSGFIRVLIVGFFAEAVVGGVVIWWLAS